MEEGEGAGNGRGKGTVKKGKERADVVRKGHEKKEGERTGDCTSAFQQGTNKETKKRGVMKRSVRGSKIGQELPPAVRIEDKGQDRQGKRKTGKKRKWT